MVSWNDGESSEDSATQYISSCDSPFEIPATIDDPNYSGGDDDLMVICVHGKPAKRCVAFEGISTGRRFIAYGIEGVNNCGVVQWLDEEWPEHLQNVLHKLWLMYEDSQHSNRLACLEHSSTVHNLTEQKKKLQEAYEKLVEEVNNLLDAQDNLSQENYQKENLKKDEQENITISVDNSMGNLNEQLVAKDAEITKLKVVVDQLKFIHVAQGNVIRNLKFNHLKEKEKMSTDKRTLEFCFADLKKEKEKLSIEKSNLDCYIAELMKEKEKLSIEKSTLECCIADLRKVGENNKRKLKEIKGICDEE